MTHSEQVRQYFDRHAARYDNPFTTFIGIHELRAIQKTRATRVNRPGLWLRHGAYDFGFAAARL